MTREMYRQGDLLFRAIPELPEGLTERASKVIAQGEVTGHRHCLREGRVLEDRQGALFLEVMCTTQIIHQEHHALGLPAGCYRIIRQREYTPEAIREVAD
jgi:hypothetical protein